MTVVPVSLSIDIPTPAPRFATIRPEDIGILPNLSTVDSAPLLQAMCNGITTTEALIDFGPGIWYLGSPVVWPRCVRVLGSGERLTHFRCMPGFTTGDVFDTADNGVQFENIQFSSADPRTSGAYIHFGYNYCRAKNVWATDGYGLVDVQANVCDVERLVTFNWSTDAGSFVLRVGGGFTLMGGLAGGSNIGYVTEKHGTATIVDGTTAIQVAHGLSVTPKAGKIVLTPTNAPTNNPGILRVTDITATHFYIRCLANPGASGLNVAWSYKE